MFDYMTVQEAANYGNYLNAEYRNYVKKIVLTAL